MTFQLSEQLDAYPATAFTLYKKYIENYRYKFPESVLALIENPDWAEGGKFSKAPHDGGLKSLLVEGFGTEKSRIELQLSKLWEDWEIQINYLDVFYFNLPDVGMTLGMFPSWRYEQFKYYDPYRPHGIKNKKMFT